MIDSGQKLFGKPIFFLEPGESFADESKNLPAVKIADRNGIEQLGDRAVEELLSKASPTSPASPS